MADRFHKLRPGERGQSLVEYALVLVLVGIVIIAAGVAFGERVQKMYCETVLSIDPNTDAPMCSGVDVTCSVLGMSAGGYINVEAGVTDTAGKNDIEKVSFYVDGTLVQNEYVYRYCLSGGDASCSNRKIGSGKHTISIVAFDKEGNSGKCEVTRTVP
jgi:Flp pilus assembly pilin Flp